MHARRLAYLAGTIALGCGGGNGAVRPGDTIWLRGGTYSGEFTSTLTGSGRSPIIVRGLSGERATIDGRLNVFGADAVYWGLELMQSDPVATGEDALDATGPSKRFINLVIHDAGKQGFSFYDAGGVSELYGSIIYNNGTHEEFDHGVYAVNDAGTKYIRDNIIFNNLAYGIHVFATPDHSVLADVHVEGNVSFNNGSISTHGMAKSNLVMGGDQPTKGMHALDNRLYFAAGATGSNARFGVAGQAPRRIPGAATRGIATRPPPPGATRRPPTRSTLGGRPPVWARATRRRWTARPGKRCSCRRTSTSRGAPTSSYTTGAGRRRPS